ncbi:MAG: hypothetical protein SPL99_05045 [Catonella sp.]|jgi:hypothetical protein|nr:hypothetical protein [Catonella sp.]MDY6355743.1 hypothetical protein [Catonella sp.]
MNRIHNTIRAMLISVLIAATLLVAACGSEETTSSSSTAAPDMSNVPTEYVLSSMVDIDNAEEIPVIVNGTVDTLSVTGLSKAANDTALTFDLTGDDAKPLITLVTLNGLYGRVSTESELDSFSKSSSRGYEVEFVDAQKRFYPGLARITCLTGMKTAYASVIDDAGNTTVYQIKLSQDMMTEMNRMVADNYNVNGGNGGWFDRAFGNNNK